MTTRAALCTPAAKVIAATLLSGGGGVMLFDVVMGQLLDQQTAHIETLERALADSHENADRCDARLERCQEARRAGCPND